MNDPSTSTRQVLSLGERSLEAGTSSFEAGVDTLQSLDPLVLSLLILAIVAVLLGGWWLVRWFRRPAGVRLQRLLSSYDEVAVLMHPNPDPDAMACAMGVAAIADSVDTETTLQYSGEIRHQENRAFRTVLELDLENVESSSELAADAVVLVDHNTARGFTGAQTIEPVAVVDHHPGNGTGTKFTDVRTEYGAASTIFVEYVGEIGATKVTDDEDTGSGLTLSPELATGLLYGIQADTNHLTNGCSNAEFDAAAYLFDAIDEDLLERIANPQVSDDVLQIKATAITEKRVEGSFAICDVGLISNVDAIPQAADELMHLEGVTAVVVYGESDGTIHLSGRSRDDRVHMGETLRHAVSDIPMANAGGHARMGGGQLSVDHMRGIGPSDGIDRTEFEERLFSALSGER
ncbi:bifunctional oligoribonuclease/PAP phosphatase NrnA [Natrarchaeobius halalkaliphilus]|uniref:Bifunctional oligoribonuclease/PAP phosphatase NrnA n=1 Tax=Natrarchaeobius halalkaliphilus TaxID=1679091 RepID=A0A3N6NWL8_9EURY|nr:DHH family phosphoesterase [Natrarchaeobius halalkaliphilus]RQG88949.1 bifunctional oligoribonuclease/PAP phosphatase NrnA [Natrarchaeobius halalkaliphilus]